MSAAHTLHSADGVLERIPGVGISKLTRNGAPPSDGDAGYAPGCQYTRLDGGVGTVFYVNEGTNLSADFNVAANIASLTASAADLNTLDVQVLPTGAGTGITTGTGTIYKNRVQLSGGIYLTSILIDLTGLASSTTDLDIIGVGAGPAHLGQITAAVNGTILGGTMTCLEVPAGGADDIDLYYATEGTGVFDAAVDTLTEIVLVTSGGAWTAGLTVALADFAASANKYLYLTGGEAGTAATYTAGKFLIQLWGY